MLAAIRTALRMHLVPAAVVILALVAMTHSGAAQAAERSCKDASKLRSLNSTVPMTLTFVNTSGMYRSLDWIDFNGQRKNYGGIQPGETKRQQTFGTHVWVVSTGPGDCLQVFVAEPRTNVVEVPRMAVDGPRSSPKKTPAQPLVCGPNYVKRNGECVVMQNCGANAFRNLQGDCDCKKHFAMRNGRCIPASATCKASEVYSSSVAQCMPRDRRNCPKGQYLNQNGVCQPNQTGS